MSGNKENLTSYLIESNLMDLNSEKIQQLITGLTASDILDALKEAQEIHSSLMNTTLGRVIL